MYGQEIKRFEQDGFRIVICMVPDYDSTFEDMEEPPDPTREPEYYPKWIARREAYERGEWHFIGLHATASLIVDDGSYSQAIKLGTDSLFGLESDQTDYIEHEVIPEIAEEAITEARKHMQKIKESLELIEEM